MVSNDVHHHHVHAHDRAHSCGANHNHGHDHAHRHHAHDEAHSCAHSRARAEAHSCGGHRREAPPACGSPHEAREFSPAPAAPSSASALQAKVRSVMRSALSQAEKQARIQAIFLSQRTPARVETKAVSSSDNFPGAGAHGGCQHYERKCWIRAECCKKYYPCRRCHDEAESHEIVRSEIRYTACTVCGDKDQPLSDTCRTCGVRFARFFCRPCKMYNDSVDRDCFHCDKCGICRVGLEEDNYHCDDCGTCMPKERQHDHPCRSRNFESNCPICHEHLATTTEEIFVLQCTHPIHAKCFDAYAQAGNFSCPLCSKAMFENKVMQDWYRKIDEQVQLDTMPEEFENKVAQVFCNDCETKTIAKFHFRFHKCKDCAGYNTTVLNQFDREDIEDGTGSDIAPTPTKSTDDSDAKMQSDTTAAPSSTEDQGGGTPSDDLSATPRKAEDATTTNYNEDNNYITNYDNNNIPDVDGSGNSERETTSDNF